MFFASGRYCEEDYAEGVARSDSIFGPYEKAPTPLLSTAIVGYSPTPGSQREQLLGGRNATHDEGKAGARQLAKLTGPGPSFALGTRRYPFVWRQGVLNGYSSTRVSLWDSLVFGRLAMGFANVRAGTRVFKLLKLRRPRFVCARPSDAGVVGDVPREPRSVLYPQNHVGRG